MYKEDVLKLKKPTTLYAVRNSHPDVSGIYTFAYDDKAAFTEYMFRVKSTEDDYWDFGLQPYNLVEYNGEAVRWHCYIFDDYWYAAAFLNWCKP